MVRSKPLMNNAAKKFALKKNAAGQKDRGDEDDVLVDDNRGRCVSWKRAHSGQLLVRTGRCNFLLELAQ
jgi:hypothetical protein